MRLMEDNRQSALFPLPLTPFERYYLADDRPEYPTTCPLDLGFSGQLQREPFHRALRQVVARHPLIGARVEDGPRGPEWVSDGAVEPAVDWADASIAIGHPAGEYLDLRRGAGLRVWVRTSADATRVVIQFHHACCDGLAVLQWVEELLILYAAAVDRPDAAGPLAESAVERLRDRGEVDLTGAPKPTLAIAIRDVWITIRVWSNLIFRTCAVVAAPARGPEAAVAQPAGGARQFLAYEADSLDRDVSQKYAERAAALGVTVNELLLRDGFLTLRRWNHGQGAPLGACRINVPVYVRGRASLDIPASNGIGFSFVTVDPDKFPDAAALLSELHEQMERIKRGKLALYFLGGLAAASRVKGAVPWALARKKSFATTVLSFVGRVLARTPLPRRDGRLVCGDVVLERISGAPPIRPLTRAAIAVLEYAGEFSISLRCDPRYFAPEDTRALLALYVEQLHETIRSAT